MSSWPTTKLCSGGLGATTSYNTTNFVGWESEELSWNRERRKPGEFIHESLSYTADLASLICPLDTICCARSDGTRGRALPSAGTHTTTFLSLGDWIDRIEGQDSCRPSGSSRHLICRPRTSPGHTARVPGRVALLLFQDARSTIRKEHPVVGDSLLIWNHQTKSASQQT